MLEHVQLLDYLLQTVFLFPYEIETELVGLFVLQVYPDMVIGCDVLSNAVKGDVVKDDGCLGVGELGS